MTDHNLPSGTNGASPVRERHGETAALKPNAEVAEPEEVDVDTQCGYTANCKPHFLQRCANPKVYLLVISLCGIMQGFAVNGINNVNISSYERRYLLSSKSAGFVASCYDVAAGLTVLFVGYFGGIGHQPRYLGCGVVSISLGSFIMCLTHFTSPPYSPLGSQSLSLTCDISGSGGTNCDDAPDEAFLKNYFYLLLLGQAFHGFGGTCLYSLGVTYLDQSVSKNVAPLYIGLMAGASVLGPAIGFILGGALLEVYVDYPNPPPEGLTSSDPSWVGAWWLGFLINAIISGVLAFFMFLFPFELPGTAEIRAAKVSEAHHNGTEELVNNAGFGLSYKDLPRAAFYLLKNPTLMCVTAVIAIEFALAAGFSTFLPKYISNQFAQTASWAAILTGFLAVPGAAFGQAFGGYLCKRLKLKVVGMLRMTLICSVVVILASPVFWARCDDLNMAGLLANYPGSPPTSETGLDSACNEGCGCSTAFYDPVCADDIQYFSPCHAGCTENPIRSDEKVDVFMNCSCPVGALPGAAMSYNNATEVKRQICPLNCALLYPVFVPVAFVLFFFTFLIGSPLTVVTLRVVPEKQRAFGVGLQWVFLRFLGSIPGPIITGAMIDASCNLWEWDCGVKGSCWVYDNAQMSFYLFLLTIILKVLSMVFNLLAIYVYKPPPDRSTAYESQVMETLANDNVSNNASFPESNSTAKIETPVDS